MAEIKRSHNWEKPKRHALTLEEQNAFISFVAQSDTYRHWLPLFTVFLGTGCRVGEIIGLRWKDCDFEKRTISINHNLIYRQQEDGTCAMHITTPKTSSGCRTIPMLDEVYRALLQEKEMQMIIRFNTAEIDGYSGFIFTNRNGYVHNLRHTFCTRFCEHETNIKVIQEIMGHADIGTTMNIYAEVTEARKKESFDSLQGKIKIS